LELMREATAVQTSKAQRDEVATIVAVEELLVDVEGSVPL
jgi:hypothetical protein